MSKLQIIYNRFSFLFVVALILISYSGNATIYYLSSSGNDENPGTSENLAWRSLSRINKSFNLHPGDQILFKRGDQWTGTLIVNTTGSAGNPIIYGAYGSGDKPKIYGSEEITNWTLHSGNIWKATFTTPISQLFVEGEKMTVARKANKGYNKITSIINQKVFTSTELEEGINYAGAKVILRGGSYYKSHTRKIISSRGNTLTLDSSVESPDVIAPNQYFIIMNKLDFLDQPGEWYYDNVTKTVYLWTPNGDSPSNYEIRGSVYADGISIINKDYIVIQDLNILQQKEKGIELSGNYIYVKNNLIENQELFGIWGEGAITHFTAEKNTISGTNDLGIYLWGTFSNIIENNVLNICEFNKLGILGTGSFDAGSGMSINGNGNIIEYNRIIGTGYNGIIWRYKTIIQFNYINNTCLFKGDGGGIYTGSSTANGSIIKYNIVDNVVGNAEGSIGSVNIGEGIYLDEGSLGITAEYNTVTRCSRGGIFLHKGNKHIIRYNTVFDATECFKARHESGFGSTVNHNTFVVNSPTAIAMPRQLLVYQDLIKSVNTYDNNTYVNPFAGKDVFRKENNYSDFPKWKSFIGSDANSKYINIPLVAGDTQKIFYNDSKQTKIYHLGNTAFRDIIGNVVNDTFSLKPFTSKILVGKNFNSVNQKPAILDQSFNFTAPKNMNDFIGKLFATEPDSGQILNYFIIQGNETDWFRLDTITGEIYLKTELESYKDLSLILVVRVTDNSISSLSDSAKITINIIGSDTSPPTISSFTIPTTAITLTIPITDFIVTDDVGITGYKLTETSVSPSPGDSAWLNTIPENYTFSNEGIMTLYAWAKDSAGNVSNSVLDTVKISLPDLSSTYSAYLFEEESGVIVKDSQSSNDGIIINEESRVEGVIGNGLAFSDSGYINLGKSFGENVQFEVTLSAWIKPAKTSSGYQGVIMHGGPNIDSYALYIQSDSKRIGFKTSGTTNFWVTVDNVTDLWDGNWHNLVATYNGTEKVIYLDNVELKKTEANGKIESGWKYNLYIGAGRDELTPTLLYKGLIDEVRIYNYALTNSEISELYHPVNRVIKKTYQIEDISICKGEDYLGWTETGQYERVLQRVLESASEADSVVITNLQVNNLYYHNIDVQICEGENYTFGTQTLYTPGEYTEQFKTVNGCDSIISLKLTVNPSFNMSIEASICEGENYTLGTQTLYATGEYTERFKTINGCDSIISLKLTVNPAFDMSIEASICEGENYIFGTQILSLSGEYSELFKTVNGCDSIVVLKLTILPAVNIKVDASICKDEIFIFGNQELNLTGEYSELFKTIYGCDSIVNLTLTVNPDYYVTEEITIPNTDHYMEWTEDGTYQRKLISSSGCDSIVVTNLTVVQGYKQTINLEKGWNIVSSNLIPVNQDMEFVMEFLRSENKLIKVQDEDDNTYEEFENQIGWINNIGKLKETEGYKIKVNTPSVIEITGLQVQLPLNIEIKKGLNLISFPVNRSLDAYHFIEPLIDIGILEKVQDEKGNAIEKWTDIGWINGIGNFNSGEGYILQANADGVLTINNISEKTNFINTSNIETSHFELIYEGNGFEHMNINISKINETPLSAGDEIAVFDNNICVGTVKLTERHIAMNAVSIPASASDLEVNNGFIEGNQIELKVWFNNTNEELKLLPEVIKGNMIFSRKSSVFIKLNKVSDLKENIDIFPNPASNKIYVQIKTLSKEGAKIQLHDITGKQILSHEVLSNSEIINIENLPSGIYFIKTYMNNKFKTQKLIII
jgi:hypothetical protein